MKKTYKTFNGENRNCFFKVGKALVEARFTPTYTTDNEFVQKAIEDSFSFEAGELQLITSSLQWLPIDRDENGFATEECLDRIFNNLPCAVAINSYGMNIYKLIPEWDKQTRDFLKSKAMYTHYISIPKLEV